MNSGKLVLLFGALAASFASCSKKDDNPDAGKATIDYTVTTTNRTGGLVNWTSGTGSSKQIAFKGNSTTRVEEYVMNTNTVDFFTNGGYLGKVLIPAGTYTNAEFNYQMTPTRNPALQLKGTYNGTPLTVNIDLFTEIATKLPSITLEAGKSYAATLQLNLATMLNGITATQLTNATRTNNEIVISAFSNSGLLQTILNNINNVMQHPVDFK